MSGCSFAPLESGQLATALGVIAYAQLSQQDNVYGEEVTQSPLSRMKSKTQFWLCKMAHALSKHL